MFCSSCGSRIDESTKFCRKCGTTLAAPALAHAKRELVEKSGSSEGVTRLLQQDPVVLVGNGLASVFIGDGFFMVAVFLSATNTSISSLLWLLLLIPAFFFFGRGLRDVWQAQQIRRRLKQNVLTAAQTSSELNPGNKSMFAALKTTSGELLSRPSVTERTTRQLK